MTTESMHQPLVAGRPDDSHEQSGGDRQGDHKPSHGMRVFVVVAGIVLVVLAAAIGVLLHVLRDHHEADAKKQLEDEHAKGVRVRITNVTTTKADRSVTLPGDVHGFAEATIYAKLSGYVKDIHVERGQHVREGDVLATLTSPENEKDVVTAAHDLAIANLDAERKSQLAPSNVTLQDRDNAIAQKQVAQSSLERARAIYGYTTLKAPFDGVVTARFVDPGALVPAATGATASATPIVAMAQVDTLRVFVYLGQDVAPFVRIGDAVDVWQDEMPARKIPAKVTYLAGALDPRTRTMQAEIDFDNRPFQMQPGTFAQVELHVKQPPSAEIPDDAIVIRDGKTNVCLVQDGKARYQPVQLGYNDGANVRVLDGLKGGETIALDVPVLIQEGDKVDAVPAKNESQGGDGGAPH
jgi:membrane fusion protein (multidrug efflux system)